MYPPNIFSARIVRVTLVTLLVVWRWRQLLEDIGFVSVQAEDRTELFVRMLKKELKRLTDIRDEFIKVSFFISLHW